MTGKKVREEEQEECLVMTTEREATQNPEGERPAYLERILAHLHLAEVDLRSAV